MPRALANMGSNAARPPKKVAHEDEDCAPGFVEVVVPQTNKDKQEAYRARQALLGLTEVRGIYLPPHLHTQLKELAKKLLAQNQHR